MFIIECKILHECMPCDFTGIAIQQQKGIDVIWPFVTGNRNEKYKHLIVRYGKGIAGRVIASGSPMEIAAFPQNIIGKSTDYPIMLAEHIVSAYAVPLLWKGTPKGALLVGYRDEHTFSTDDIKKVKSAAQKVEAILPSHFNND